jgi:hypothetical protein
LKIVLMIIDTVRRVRQIIVGALVIVLHGGLGNASRIEAETTRLSVMIETEPDHARRIEAHLCKGLRQISSWRMPVDTAPAPGRLYPTRMRRAMAVIRFTFASARDGTPFA